MVETFNGKVKLVFKNYPLKSHKVAMPAALAALAAERQGKFWEYHDLLFKNYNSLTEKKIMNLAGKTGLDLIKLEKDMKDPALAGQVQKDIRQAARAGVTGTPALFINGRKMNDRNYERLRVVINEILAEKKKK